MIHKAEIYNNDIVENFTDKEFFLILVFLREVMDKTPLSDCTPLERKIYDKLKTYYNFKLSSISFLLQF